MSSFLSHCCSKLNYLLCGSNESSAATKKKKFKIRQQGIVSNTSSNNKVINRTEPTSLDSYHHHYVNVTPLHQRTIQQQNSIKAPSLYENINSKHNSYIDQLNSDRSSSILSNGILIKDVILRRMDPNERLGLTLCYGITSKSTTNIYILQIDQESLASRQGELRSGDQIIKINNHRVTSRDEAINLINGACRVLLQIIRFQFPPTTIPLTEDDSGVIFASCNPIERFRSLSLSLTALNHCSNCRRIQSCSEQFQYRRCLSLNDLRPCSISYNLTVTKSYIRSQSIFGTTTDNEQWILKPLPFGHRRDDSDSGLVCNRSRSNDSHRSPYNPNQWTLKHFRRRCREQRLQEQYQTTDDEPMSELKQGKYWTRKQRKEQFVKAKQYRQRAKFFQQHSIAPYSDSATEDFNLLNRIFLRENEHELKEKPSLAYQYGQQSAIERNRLQRMVERQYLTRIRTQSNTTRSISSTIDRPSMIVL